MPRKARDERLDTRTARLKLRPRPEPYWRTLQEGRALGYRRLGGGKAGKWIARHYTPTDGRKYLSIGSADDLLDADGADTLTFAQAQARAAGWFRDIERGTGRVLQPITVAEAMGAYVADYLARGGKAERDLRTTIKAHILPDLGGKNVASLTNATLRAWHHRLSAAPARLRTGAKAKHANVRAPEDGEGRRGRRSTANRVLTVLKAALSLAYRDGRVQSDDTWRRVRPFPNVDAPRVRYLTDDEALRLVNACGADLRGLVTAALLTAMRYGELARLRAADFDEDAGLLHIREAKGGKPRCVPLTDEGRRFFESIAAGKPGGDLLLTSTDGAAWGKSHQHRPLIEACAVARIAPAVSFHILRHTAASRLVQRGVPMAVIAALLGNTEAICARHYAHLAPSYVNETIRRAAGNLGIVPDKTNPEPLRARAGA
jgi:integrase